MMNSNNAGANNRPLYGYDIDGVLCESTPKREKPFFSQNSAERAEHKSKLLAHYENARRTTVIPKEPFIAITGRPSWAEDATLKWFDRVGLKPVKVLLNPFRRTREDMIKHKTEACLRNGVAIFFEDDPQIAKAVQKIGVPTVLIERYELSEMEMKNE